MGMSAPKKKSAPVKPKLVASLEDMFFYFDAVERDRMDGGAQARKASELLALREQLVRLPDAEFDTVMKTVRSVLKDQTLDEDETAAGKARRRRSSIELYQETEAAKVGGGGGGSVAKVSKI